LGSALLLGTKAGPAAALSVESETMVNFESRPAVVFCARPVPLTGIGSSGLAARSVGTDGKTEPNIPAERSQKG
jgi:hypothetical protein